MPRGHSCLRTAAPPSIPLFLLAYLAFGCNPLHCADNAAAAQFPAPHSDTLAVTDTLLHLGAHFVVPASLEFLCDGVPLPDSLYSLEPAAGIIRFHRLPPVPY